MQGGVPSSGGGGIIDTGNIDITENNPSSGTLTESGDFFYNQIIANASMITDDKAKAMIKQKEDSGEISPEDASIIRKKLGL